MGTIIWVTGIWATDELWITVSGPTTPFTTDEEIQIQKSRGPAGLRHFDGEQWQHYASAANQNPKTVHALSTAGDGVFWVATQNGLLRFDHERWRLYRSASPTGLYLTKVRGDTTGTLLFSSTDALYTWDGTRWRRQAPEGWSNVWSGALWVGKANDVWIGNWQDGAAHWDGLAWQRYTADYGLASNTVRSVWSGAPGSIWFGTDAGLSHLEQASGEWQTLTIINSDLPGSTVTALWGDGQAL